MNISDKELEKQLLDAGNKLLSPPSSLTELLDVLELVESLLAGVEQSPPQSMKEALIPSTNALIKEELLRHSDADVKVAVALCISEITRITAPEAPYADDQMKEVFQLIVSCFEKLDDKSSRSYTKRTSILETVAKVRSCVVMLDLECDELIVVMFRHFFRTIRDDHDDGVFSSMETIMALVVEESEDISVDLLSSMLDVLKKENKEVLPIARQLGEKVIAQCASKLKPYLLPVVRSSGASVDDYCKAVADVYKVGDEVVEPSDGDASKTTLADDNDLIDSSSEKAVEVAMETLEDAPLSEEVAPSTVGSSKTLMSNGILQKGNGDSSAVNHNSKEAVHDTEEEANHDTEEEANHDTEDEKGEPSKTIADSINTGERPKSKKKSKKSNRRKGKKSSSSKKSVKSNRVTEVIDTPEHRDDAMDVDNLQSEDPAVGTTDAADNEKSSNTPIPSPKASQNERADISPPSPSGSLPDKIRSKKAGERNKKEDPVQEGETAGDVDHGKESDIKKDSEAATGSKSIVNKHASTNSSSASDQEESVHDSADDIKKKDDNIHDLDDNPAKDLAQETEVSSQLSDKNKRGRAKTTSAKGHKKTPAKDEQKKAVTLPKSTTPKTTKDKSDVEEASKSSSKRKRPSEEKAPKTKVYGSELVGATVKVWWPEDKKFYQGVIDSFDAAKKTHKILYCDGDIEVLNLKKEKWHLADQSKGHAEDGESPDESADETPKGKKSKTSANSGAKQGKTGSSAKKSGVSSSKSKATPKSGSKQMDDSKIASNYKESTKKAGKSDGKFNASRSDIKLSDYISKSAKKSEDDDDMDTLKSISKSKKQGTAISAAKSKGKSPKSVGKSNSSTSGKVKARTSTYDDETEDESLEPETIPERSKSKSHNTPKSQKSSKKKKRSLKG